MGKIDDMRRQREAKAAADERAQKARASGTTISARASVPVVVPVEDVPVTVETSAPIAMRKKAAAATEGACSVCGKIRPVHKQQVATHQKGLGKVCPGSRKPPAT
jgi:hypothetical protein